MRIYMKHKIFLMMLAALMSMKALSVHADKVLALVWAENGCETYFAVANSPIITVSGNEVSVTGAAGKGKTVRLSIGRLKHFELKEIDLTLDKGDVNKDGKKDVADVTCLVNILTGRVSEYDSEGTDIDGDGGTTKEDLTELIKQILGK